MQCRLARTCPDFLIYKGENKDLVWIGNINPDIYVMYLTGEKFDNYNRYNGSGLFTES